MFNIDKIKDEINNLDEGSKVSLWNDYCEANGYYDDMIEYNDTDELLYGLKPSEVLDRIDKNDYSQSDRYCAVDGWGEYVSFDYVDGDNSPFDLSALAQWIYDNEDACGFINEDDITDYFNHNDFVDGEMDEDDIEQFLISNDISFDEDDDEITKADLVKDYLEYLDNDVDEIVAALDDLGWLCDIEERVLQYFI